MSRNIETNTNPRHGKCKCGGNIVPQVIKSRKGEDVVAYCDNSWDIDLDHGYREDA